MFEIGNHKTNYSSKTFEGTVVHMSVVWAGEQEGQKLKKQKIDTWVDNFTYMGTRPTEPIITKFGVRGLVADEITGDKFCRDRLRGFQSVGVRKWGSPIDLGSRPYNSSALQYCL